MDSRYLQSLIFVVEQGSIAAAARAQNLTPAAISQRIQALEHELNCPLLDRSSHKAVPTHHAVSLLPRARHIVQQTQALMGDIDQDGLTGPIRIGAIDSVLSSLFPKAMVRINKIAPRARCQITPGTSALLYDAVQQQNVDIAITVAPTFSLPKSLVQTHLFEEPYALISHKKAESVEQALREQPYIRYDQNSWGGHKIAQWLKEKKIATNVIADLDALHTIAQMVNAGAGVSVIPLWAGIRKQLPQLKIIPLNNPELMRPIVAIHPHYPERPALVSALISALAEAASEATPAT
ncbi:LysR family transcriptional regulator [Hahella ganghwensis]|uniref:LysR family transcriptional regulator n=1 Tax=Hahella ganghwensis TaxID=286420 RepID=UPI00038189CE|nr:LysR family transcriptional regulator [Hahella ganghwensis]